MLGLFPSQAAFNYLLYYGRSALQIDGPLNVMAYGM